MDGWLKQSTAIDLRVGPFLDETDGKTAETELTVTQAEIRLSKAGGDFAQKTEATSLVHDELGYYICKFDVTDTATLGMLKLAIHEAGALPVWHDWMVLPANVWDSLFSTDKLQVDLTQINGAAQTATLDTIKAETVLIVADTNELQADDYPTSIAAIKAETALIVADTGTDGVILKAAGLDADAATEIATAVWAKTGAVTSIATELLLERLYEMINDKMIVTEATGDVALRNIADDANIATGNVQDLGATTQRNGLTWT